LEDTNYYNRRAVIQSGYGDIYFYPNTFISGLPAVTIRDQSGDIHVRSGFLSFDTPPSNRITLPNIANANGRGIAYAWIVYSSRRWKENIRLIDNPLAKVERLRGVYYDWKENKKHDIGLIAEEVGEVVPEVVTYEKNGKDAQSVDYARLTPLLVEAGKELKAANRALDRRTES